MSIISTSSNSTSTWSGDPYPYNYGTYTGPNYYDWNYPWQTNPWDTTTYPVPKTWTTDNTQGIEWPIKIITPPTPTPSDKNIEDLMKLFEKYYTAIPESPVAPEPKPEPPKEQKPARVGRFTDLDLDNDI